MIDFVAQEMESYAMDDDRPLILITNDDGIESVLLRSMAARLSAKFYCAVAVPDQEHSFCGRKITQDREIKVTRVDDFGCLAYAVNGSPVDSVNIALEHYLPRPADLVLSGPNIGRNCGVWTVLSSGTVAGAVEAALCGVRGLAVSQSVDGLEMLRRIKAAGSIPADFEGVWARSLDWIEGVVVQTLSHPDWQRESLGIWNINLPHKYAGDALPETYALSENPLAQTRYGSVFERLSDHTFRYAHARPKRMDPTGSADIDRIINGYPSRTWLG